MEKDFVLCEAGNKYLFIGDMNFGLKKVKFHIKCVYIFIYVQSKHNKQYVSITV
jgi:hypothetical protein